MGRPRYSKSANNSRQPSRISSPIGGSLLALSAEAAPADMEDDEDIDVDGDAADDSELKQSAVDDSNVKISAGADGTMSNISLSTLKSRFMKGKANPFANLMSQLKPSSAAGSNSATAESDDAVGSDSTANVDYDESDDDQEAADGASSEDGFTKIKKSKLAARGFSSLDAYQAQKKRKADNPKKNSGGSSSETIVPKKPKNLYMMLDLQQQRGGTKSGKGSSAWDASKAGDEYDFDDSEDGGTLVPPQHKFESTKKVATVGVKSIQSAASIYDSDGVRGGREAADSNSSRKAASSISMQPYAETSDEEDERQVQINSKNRFNVHVVIQLANSF